MSDRPPSLSADSSTLRLQAGERLVVASHNQGKVAEMTALFAPYAIDIVSGADLGLAEPQETGDSFAANAELKAQAAAQEAAMPALADDSGLAVAALGGQPGICSARWGGPKRDFGQAMRRIFAQMPAHADPTAHFICALCIAWPAPREITAVFTGQIAGRVVWPPRGTQGFGYDPIFIPEGQETTFGEMAAHEKDRFSHRRQAFDRFAQTCLPPVL